MAREEGEFTLILKPDRIQECVSRRDVPQVWYRSWFGFTARVCGVVWCRECDAIEAELAARQAELEDKMALDAVASDAVQVADGSDSDSTVERYAIPLGNEEEDPEVRRQLCVICVPWFPLMTEEIVLVLPALLCCRALMMNSSLRT